MRSCCSTQCIGVNVLTTRRPCASSFSFCFVERDFARQTLEMLHHAVARDAEEVSRQRPALGVVLLGFAHQGHEHVLHDFFRRPGVSGHAHGETIQRSLMPAIEEGKGILIALGGTPQQNVVPGVVSGILISPDPTSRSSLLALLAFYCHFRSKGEKVPATTDGRSGLARPRMGMGWTRR